MGNAAGYGQGFLSGLGFGSVAPDPLQDLKDQLTKKQQDLRTFIDQSNIRAFQLFQQEATQEFQTLQKYMDKQVSLQQINDEFINEKIQIQGLTLIIVSIIVAIMITFSFISK